MTSNVGIPLQRQHTPPDRRLMMFCLTDSVTLVDLAIFSNTSNLSEGIAISQTVPSFRILNIQYQQNPTGSKLLKYDGFVNNVVSKWHVV